MTTTKLTAADGHSFGAYTAGANHLTVGLVVVQEIFGVNHHMRHASDVLAGAGFKVICPAIFDRAERDVELGYSGEDMQKGIALRSKVKDADTLLDLDAAALALGTPRVGNHRLLLGRHARLAGSDPQQELPGGGGAGMAAASRRPRPRRRIAPCNCISAPRTTTSR